MVNLSSPLFLGSWGQFFCVAMFSMGFIYVYLGKTRQRCWVSLIFCFRETQRRKIRGLQAFGLHSKALNHMQVFGASLTVLGGVLYGRSRQAIELEVEERKALLPGK